MSYASTLDERRSFAVVLTIASLVFIVAALALALSDFAELRRGHASLSWPTVEATIVAADLGPVLAGGGNRRRPRHTLAVQYEYDWAGEVRTGNAVGVGEFAWWTKDAAREALRGLRPGTAVRAAVDPASSEAVLVPGIVPPRAGGASFFSGFAGLGAAALLFARGVAGDRRRPQIAGVVLFLVSMLLAVSAAAYFYLVLQPPDTVSAVPILAWWLLVVLASAGALGVGFRRVPQTH